MLFLFNSSNYLLQLCEKNLLEYTFHPLTFDKNKNKVLTKKGALFRYPISSLNKYVSGKNRTADHKILKSLRIGHRIKFKMASNNNARNKRRRNRRKSENVLCTS